MLRSGFGWIGLVVVLDWVVLVICCVGCWVLCCVGCRVEFGLSLGWVRSCVLCCVGCGVVSYEGS